MNYEVENILQRWESTGLLDGLPQWEKEELAQIYDNTTKLLLAKKTIDKLPKNTFEQLENCYIPVCRRLYRRLGINFDVENMMSDLLISVENNIEELVKNEVTENKRTALVEFCINFADNYEDEISSKEQLSDEEYVERVDKILEVLKEILLDDRVVSYVNRDETEWKIIKKEEIKSPKQTRFWNQRVGFEFLKSTFSELNKT